MTPELLKLITGYGVLGVAVIAEALVILQLWRTYQALLERFNAKSETYASKLEENAKAQQAMVAELLARATARRSS